MDQILRRKKHYEQLVMSHEDVYEDVLRAITIVKNFIIQEKLIIYGGSAIDYALRLHGSNIYDDKSLQIPDLDFYSPNHAEHAYSLADLLYDAGFSQARTIVAVHTRTMRVDAVDNHFVADISYVPPEIFPLLPYIVYEGMRVIHPDFQRIDVHSSLSIPYGNPPAEDIFSRWQKDIERFNKFAQYYPIVVPNIKTIGKRLKLPLDVRHYIFTGIAAYSVLYVEYKRLMQELHLEPDSTIPAAEFSIDMHEKSITLSTHEELELAHTDLQKISSELNVLNVKLYESYINLLPEIMTGKFKHPFGECDIKILSTHNRLVACNIISFNTGFETSDRVRVRITGTQFLLKYFLATYFRYKAGNSAQVLVAPVYLKYYHGLMRMIESYETAISETADAQQLAMNCPLFPTLYIYGNDNKSLSYEVNMMWTMFALKRGNRPLIPGNYYPARTRIHPVFDPSSSAIFRESGKLIESADA